MGESVSAILGEALAGLRTRQQRLEAFEGELARVRRAVKGLEQLAKQIGPEPGRTPAPARAPSATWTGGKPTSMRDRVLKHVESLEPGKQFRASDIAAALEVPAANCASALAERVRGDKIRRVMAGLYESIEAPAAAVPEDGPLGEALKHTSGRSTPG